MFDRPGSTELFEAMRKVSGNSRPRLFIKKDDAEGKDFYYIGKMITDFDSKEQTQIPNEKGQMLPVVNIQFDIVPPVPQNLYNYLEGA